jgi:hemerythrin
MALTWTPDLSVGIEMIDKQHQELFKRVNDLLAASGQGKGKDEIGNVVKFLESYVVFHFGAEERYMAQQAYPALAAHKQEHAKFLKDFAALKGEWQAQGASTSVVMRMHAWLGGWLRNHIGKVDKAIGAYMKVQA